MKDELVDARVAGAVRVMHWNPRRPALTGRLGRRLPQPAVARVRNFGDLLGPEVVRRVRLLHGLPPTPRDDGPRLLSVGSILHFARDGDVVWGSGINGRILPAEGAAPRLDVRAVRGPRTAAFLAGRGTPVPAVHGDPALLVPVLMPELAPGPAAAREDWVVVPNLHDAPRYGRDRHVVHPRGAWRDVVARIARARVVYASSLHGLVLAEAFGLPAHRIASGTEQDLKYEDYALGTGSQTLRAWPDLETALRSAGGADRRYDPDPTALLEAFPHDLW